MNHKQQQRFIIITILIIVTIGSFIGVIHNGFINYDDPAYVVRNTNIQSGLALSTVVWAFTATIESNWHPLTWLSHALDYSLFGLEARYHHAMSLFLHLLTSVMVFILFELMTGKQWQSAFIACVFAIHPLHVESVAWIAERKDILSGLFWFATMIAYTKYTRSFSLLWYWAALILFILGLMAKPMLVSLPFVLLIIDYWPLDRLQLRKFRTQSYSQSKTIPIKRILLEKIPFIIFAGLSSVITFFIQQHGGSMAISSRLPLDERLGNAVVAYCKYIGKIFLPIDLAIFYPHPLGTLESWQIIGAMVVILVITTIAWRYYKTQKYIATGWLWFLGTLVPVIGIVQVGLQSMADRYMYIPIIGVAIILAWGMPTLAKRFKLNKNIPGMAFAVTVPFMIWGTYTQTTYWKDNRTLFEHALAVTSNNHIAHNNLGVDLADSGKHVEALVHLREALRLWPDAILVHGNLAASLLALGERQEALTHYYWILQRTPIDVHLQNRIADVLADEGDFNSAIEHYREVFRLDSTNLLSRCKVGKLLAQQSKFDEAKSQCLFVLSKDPRFSMAHDILGTIAGEQQMYEEAIQEFTEAIRLDSTNADAYNDLGIVYDNLGNESEAFPMYQRAVHFNGEQWNAHFNLGTLYAKKRQFDTASFHLSRAVELFPTAINARLNLAKIYTLQGNLAAATEQYAAIIKLDPANVSAHYHYGILLAKQNNLSDAGLHFREALRIAPTYHEAQIALDKIHATIK